MRSPVPGSATVRRSTRRTVADPGTGERIERSETHLI